MVDLTKDDAAPTHWYARPQWLAALAALIAASSFAGFVTTTVFTSERTSENSEDIGSLEHVVAELQSAVQGIEKNQEGIDELVAFVRDLQSQPQGNGTRDAVEQVLDVLCASSDPVRVQACSELVGR